MTTKTERGFLCFDSLTDSYGAKVDVVESSRAMIEGNDDGPWVWIFIKGGGVNENEGAAHLELDEAVRVRDALTEFIDGVGEGLE